MERPNDILIQRVLNEKATPEEAQLVAAWFSTDDGCRWLSNHMDNTVEQILSGKIPLLADIPTEELLQRINREINRRRRRTLLIRVAAVLIPCAVIMAVWMDIRVRLGVSPFSPTAEHTEICARGEKRELIFQDGTKIWMNADTKLSYPSNFGLSERRVKLDGEAYFEVASNVRRPFIVEINGVEVRVLGTSFNVEAYDRSSIIEIVLIDGKIEFHAGSIMKEMSPYQKLIYDKEHKRVQIFNDSNAYNQALWHDKILYFRDATLGEVITTLEYWYDCRFFVTSPAAYERRFSLQTKDVPLRELLNEMQQISDLKFELTENLVRVNIK